MRYYYDPYFTNVKKKASHTARVTSGLGDQTNFGTKILCFISSIPVLLCQWLLLSHWLSSYHVLRTLLYALCELSSFSLVTVPRGEHYYASFAGKETEAY